MIFCEILSIQRNVVNENLQISSLTGGEEKRGKGNEYCFVLHDWEFNLTGPWLEKMLLTCFKIEWYRGGESINSRLWKNSFYKRYFTEFCIHTKDGAIRTCIKKAFYFWMQLKKLINSLNFICSYLLASLGNYGTNKCY